MTSSRASGAEAKAVVAERSISSKTSQKAALDAAITSAELYMQALKLSDDASEKKRLNTKLSQILATAELLKSKQDRGSRVRDVPASIDKSYPISTRKLKTREEIILLEGSKLNGYIFKPWKQAPDDSEFEMKAGNEFYTEPMLSLSSDQQHSFAGWERGRDAIRHIKMYKDGDLLPTDPIMTLPGRPDLVQDMASDCSVVASLCAGAARAERGHTRILGTMLFPYELSDESVRFSQNGKYVLRLYFNGCWRRVDIDDYLPTSKTARVLHVVDRSHPGLLWPAFVEKAYLKVRNGGYDFPGSNSGTDLAVFTGWIPQQVFLHDEDMDQDALWDELLGNFEDGNILLTIGTGKLSRREQKQLGLAAEHDYAILDIKHRDGIKEMLIKNPWSDGEVWKGAARRRPNPNHESEEVDLQPPAEDSLDMLPGTFWMDYNSVFHHFENMYINWNPGLFHERHDVHFSWQVPELPATPNICSENPQFSIKPAETGEIWVLLNRHFRTGDYTHSNSGKNGFISLYLYDRHGHQVISTEGATVRGPFVDSPNTLLRFHAQAKSTYTIVVISQYLPAGKHNFTMTAFSQSRLNLIEAPSRYSQHIARSAAWTRSTAGGNTDSPNYLQNPQFAIPIAENNTSVALVLRLSSETQLQLNGTDVHVRLLLLYSPAQDRPSRLVAAAHRVDKLRNRDIVATSGDYRRGSAVIETTLQSGVYTVICSTFVESQLIGFTIELCSSSDQQAVLMPVPSEGSGRLSVLSNPAMFEAGIARFVAPLTVPRICRTRFIARAKQRLGGRASSVSTLYRLSILQGHGPYAKVIATSSTDESAYTSIYSGLRVHDVDLSPDLHGPSTAGLWLVLDRPSQHTAENSINNLFVEVEALCEERLQIGDWEVVDV